MVSGKGVFCHWPVLFLLYISSLLDKLRGAEVRIRCKYQLMLTLLYTDDMVIFVANLEMHVHMHA